MLYMDDYLESFRDIKTNCKECGGENKVIDIDKYYEAEEETDGRIYNHLVITVYYKCSKCNKESIMAYV